MSCVAQQDIPDFLLPPAPILQKAEAIGTLKAFAFITLNIGQESYDVHLLVQIVVCNWLRTRNKLALYRGEALERIANAFPYPQQENRSECAKCLSHAQHILNFRESLGGSEDCFPHLLHKVADYFLLTGKFSEAEQINEELLKMNQEMLGATHPSTLNAMNSLARVLDCQGRYKRSEEIHRQTLELRQQVLGVHHPDTLHSMNNLAVVLDNQGKYKEAEEMHQRTLELSEKVLGVHHPDALSSMKDLADVLEEQGKNNEAAKIRQIWSRKWESEDQTN